MENKININEIFGPTIQGEGSRAGRLCMFIRTNGCNLRCMWLNPDGKTYTKCDTTYTSWNPEKGNMMSVEEIREKVYELAGDYDCSFTDIVITGGEPFLQPGIVDLINDLVSEGFYVTVETNGTIFKESKADLISMSPKLTTSVPTEIFKSERDLHIKNRVYDNSIPKFKNYYKNIQYKFVYSNEKDLDEINDFNAEYFLGDSNIWLMPQGEDLNTLAQHTTECMNQAIKNDYNFTSRLHILAYGTKRGV